MVVVLVTDRDGRRALSLEGELVASAVPGVTKRLFEAVDAQRSGEVSLDLSGLTRVDTVGAGLISAVKRRCDARAVTFCIVGAQPSVVGVLNQFLWLETPRRQRRTIGDHLEALGERVQKWGASGRDFLQLVADTVIWSIAGEKRTQKVRGGAVWEEACRIGLDALGIISLLIFLVGAVVALQTASLLRLFGAEILVADMIGISMVRELAPLMTAILVSGRSGAAIAAEIATMSINEEIAAIRTMGLEPVKYVVVPKFRAITLTMPGLTIFAMCCGILGGFLVAVLYMGLSPGAFMAELMRAIHMKDVLVSLLKCVFFAWIIVWVAAHQGFSAYGGSEAVGRVTTSSVVLSIFWCIVADAIFSVIFYF